MEKNKIFSRIELQIKANKSIIISAEAKIEKEKTRIECIKTENDHLEMMLDEFEKFTNV